MYENADNKLSYMGDAPDGGSIYIMRLAGRDVFSTYVHKNEDGMPIRIRKIGDVAWTMTSSRAFTVEDGSRVSAMSMKEAVYGNLPWLLADLLAPKN